MIAFLSPDIAAVHSRQEKCVVGSHISNVGVIEIQYQDRGLREKKKLPIMGERV